MSRVQKAEVVLTVEEEKTGNEQEAEADPPHHLPVLPPPPPHPLLHILHPAVHHHIVTPAPVAQILAKNKANLRRKGKIIMAKRKEKKRKHVSGRRKRDTKSRTTALDLFKFQSILRKRRKPASTV